MQFQNIDIDIDIEIRLFKILIPILILKFFCILILVLILILEKLDQYFFKFSRDFYRGYLAFTEQILSDCLDSFAKTLIFLYNYCPLGENFMLNELFDDRKTLVLTKELIFIIMAQ